MPGENAEVAGEPEADTTHPTPARRRAGPEDAVKHILLAALVAAMVAAAGTVVAQGTAIPTFSTHDAQLVRADVIGLLPHGMRVNSYYAGTVTEGLFAGLPVEGIDYVLIRHDGVMVIDSRGVILLPNGLVVAYSLKGYWDAPAEMPPLEALLEPEFQFPDEDILGHGVAWFETMVPEYAFLNHTMFDMHGTYNMATGDMLFTYTAMVD
jgi:hypothetical protein